MRTNRLGGGVRPVAAFDWRKSVLNALIAAVIGALIGTAIQEAWNQFRLPKDIRTVKPLLFNGRAAADKGVVVCSADPKTGTPSFIVAEENAYVLKWTWYEGGYGNADLVSYGFNHPRGTAHLQRRDDDNVVQVDLYLLGQRPRSIELQQVR